MSGGGRTISVIIPTAGRPAVLLEVLPSYLAQRGVAEVILVNDAPEPLGRLLEEAFPAPASPIRVVEHPRNLGSPAARNTGIEAARGEHIFIGEDDVLLMDGYLETLLGELERLGGGIITGVLYQLLGDEDPEAARARARQTPGPLLDLERYALRLDAPPPVTTEVPFLNALILARRELVASVRYCAAMGGPSYLREDLEFCLAARQQGARCYLCPGAEAVHLARVRTHGAGSRARLPLAMALSAAANAHLVVDRHFDLIRADGYRGSAARLKARWSADAFRQTAHRTLEAESGVYGALLGGYRRGRRLFRGLRERLRG